MHQLDLTTYKLWKHRSLNVKAKEIERTGENAKQMRLHLVSNLSDIEKFIIALTVLTKNHEGLNKYVVRPTGHFDKGMA